MFGDVAGPQRRARGFDHDPQPIGKGGSRLGPDGGGDLRLGGVVGEGAWIDHAFNTTDVFLLMDTGAMSAKHKQFYESRWQPT